MWLVLKWLRYVENDTKYKTKTPENLLFRKLSGVSILKNSDQIGFKILVGQNI